MVNDNPLPSEPEERVNWFDRANYFIRNTEASVVNFFSAIAPWGAPVAPAYTSFRHMTDSLDYPWYVAIFVAAVVEILGFSAINTIIGFWTFNKQANRGRLAEHKKAPVGLAVGSFVAYLMVVITINILLDAANVIKTSNAQSLMDAFSLMTAESWVQVAGRGLLVFLSIPAGVIMAIRTQHKEAMDDMEREKRKVEGTVRVSPNGTGTSSTISKAKRKFISELRSGDLRRYLETQGLTVNVSTVAEVYEVSTRTARRWLDEYKEHVN